MLVADDQTHIARMLASVLTGQGYQVHTTADGEAAFEHFSRWRPGLMMTDLHRPLEQA